jgi:hypothetical protein
VRASNSDLLNETSVSPRISLAYKVAKYSQFSLAYGTFSQLPKPIILSFQGFISLKAKMRRITSSTSNTTRTGKPFRAEAYYKDYDNLVKFNSTDVNNASFFSNNGYGYAQGLDLFWRDGYNIKNLEYWVSYSYIDTKGITGIILRR